MNALRVLLFKLWIRRTNARWERAFLGRMEQEQDTVRLKWDAILGSEINQGRHHLRKG